MSNSTTASQSRQLQIVASRSWYAAVGHFQDSTVNSVQCDKICRLQSCRHELFCRQSMLKISYAGCFGLSPAILAQFTLEIRVAARNHKNSLKLAIFEVQSHSRSSIYVDISKKLDASACYDEQHVCAYLQPFSR